MSASAELFKGLKNASIFERGVFLQPGVYDLEIDKVITKRTRKSGDGLIVEFKVLTTTDEKNHPAKSKATWFQKMTDVDVAFGAIKLFLYAVLGYNYSDPEDKAKIAAEVDPVIEGLMGEAVGDDQPLRGRRVRVRTYMKKTALKQADFTVHDWQPYEDKQAA